jgi:hypothetical protein
VVGGHALRVEETQGARWELALERLRAGDTIIFREVSLSIRPDGFVALIQSTWTTAAEQTPERARADIARAEHIVEVLRAADPTFAELVADREIEYHAIDDYGMGAIWLAELRGDRYTWTGPPYPEPDAPESRSA